MIATARHHRAADELGWTESQASCAFGAITPSAGILMLTLGSHVNPWIELHSPNGALFIARPAHHLIASANSHAIQYP